MCRDYFVADKKGGCDTLWNQSSKNKKTFTFNYTQNQQILILKLTRKTKKKQTKTHSQPNHRIRRHLCLARVVFQLRLHELPGQPGVQEGGGDLN